MNKNKYTIVLSMKLNRGQDKKLIAIYQFSTNVKTFFAASEISACERNFFLSKSRLLFIM